MKVKEDARIKKTRDKLYTAYLSLLSEKTYEDISISDVCDRATVRRATFYKHFPDKLSFSAVMVETFISRFDASLDPEKYRVFPIEYHVAYERRLVKYLTSNINIVNMILKSNMFATLCSLVIQKNYLVLRDRLELSVKGGATLVAKADTVALVLAGGIGALITRWFEDGMPIPEEELCLEIEKMVKAVFVK